MKTFQNRIVEKLFDIAQHVEPVNQARLASAIVFKKDIVSFGFNSWKTHTKQKKYADHPEKIYIHAEIDAIIKASRHLTEYEFRKSSIYIVRAKYLYKGGPMCYGLAKPCAGCMNGIVDMKIKNIFYSCDICDIDKIEI